MTTKKHKTSSFKYPPLKYWDDLDEQAKDKKRGERIRIDALEWLRCESLKRAYSHIPDSYFRELNKQEWQDALDKELLNIRSGSHHWLIRCGKRPPGGAWIYPYFCPGLHRALAFEVLKPGQTERSPERLVLSIDPSRPEAEIVQQVRAAMKTWKQDQNKQRARGGGRRHPLATLWEALEAHDKWRNGMKQLAREHKLIALAKEMMDTAQHHPATWLKQYL